MRDDSLFTLFVNKNYIDSKPFVKTPCMEVHHSKTILNTRLRSSILKQFHSTIYSLDPSKSCGPDNIPARVLKHLVSHGQTAWNAWPDHLKPLTQHKREKAVWPRETIKHCCDEAAPILAIIFRWLTGLQSILLQYSKREIGPNPVTINQFL